MHKYTEKEWQIIEGIYGLPNRRRQIIVNSVIAFATVALIAWFIV